MRSFKPMSFMRVGGIALITLAAFSAQAVELETEEQKLGYVFGMSMGQSLKQQGTEVDIEAVIEALRTVYSGGVPALTQEEAADIQRAYVQKRQEAMAAEQAAAAQTNLVAAEAFLAENAGKEGVVTTESGLQYKVLEQGDGPRPSATDTVTVHYRGTLLDGTEFDSSYARNEPISFGLDRVIPGWTEGVQLMPVGSKYMFFIKPELGYGAAGGGPIPPNAALIFEVELLDIQG
jgi:FKBP-type peptidyl-prolyl cis-trans isomerase FkpA/FKBP-type peptidyl-prolyl cis-trans isomerase FklB